MFALDLVAGLETDWDKVLNLVDGVEPCHSEVKEGRAVVWSHAAVDKAESEDRRDPTETVWKISVSRNMTVRHRRFRHAF